MGGEGQSKLAVEHVTAGGCGIHCCRRQVCASVAPVADDADVTVSGEATVHVSGSCDPDNFVRINGTSRIPASYDH